MFVTGDTAAVSCCGFVVDGVAVEKGREESVGPAGAEDEEVDVVGGGGGGNGVRVSGGRGSGHDLVGGRAGGGRRGEVDWDGFGGERIGG